MAPESERSSVTADAHRCRQAEALPRHVWLVDESTNSRKPPLIAVLLELRRIENDGPVHSRAAEPPWRGLVAVAYPGGGMRVWWERTEVLIPFEAWPAPV